MKTVIYYAKQLRNRWRVIADYGDGFPIAIAEFDEKENAEKFCDLLRGKRAA